MRSVVSMVTEMSAKGHGTPLFFQVRKHTHIRTHNHTRTHATNLEVNNYIFAGVTDRELEGPRYNHRGVFRTKGQDLSGKKRLIMGFEDRTMVFFFFYRYIPQLQ